MTSFKPPSILKPKFVAPQVYGFIAYDNTSFSQQVLDISMTEIKQTIEPNGVLDYIGRESVTLIIIHRGLSNRS